MTNKEKGLLAELRKNVRRKSQNCYSPKCSNLAIRSHIQQAEGAIRCISSADGKVVQLEDLDTNFSSNTYGFSKKGIIQKGDVLTFWGFCNSCDSKLFKPIESKIIDYYDYKNQLLHSYRGFLSEFYKQEYAVKYFKSIFKSDELSEEVKVDHKNRYVRYVVTTKVSEHIKKLFEADIFGNSINFEFITLELPKIEVCTSTVFSLPEVMNINVDTLENIESIPPVSNFNFINLIPTEKKLFVIFGEIRDDKLKEGLLNLKKVLNMPQKEQIKLISDILLRHIETWFVSESLYNKWQQRKMEKEILQIKENHLPPHMKRKHIKFNIFQDIT